MKDRKALQGNYEKGIDMQSSKRTYTVSITSIFLFFATTLLIWQKAQIVPPIQLHAARAEERQEGIERKAENHARLLPRLASPPTLQDDQPGPSTWQGVEQEPRAPLFVDPTSFPHIRTQPLRSRPKSKLPKLPRYNGVWVFESHTLQARENGRLPEIGTPETWPGGAKFQQDMVPRITIANLLNAWINKIERSQTMFHSGQILDVHLQWMEGYPAGYGPRYPKYIPSVNWEEVRKDLPALSGTGPDSQLPSRNMRPKVPVESSRNALKGIPPGTVIYAEWQTKGLWRSHEFHNQGDYTDTLQGDVWMRIVTDGELAGEYIYKPMPPDKPSVQGATQQDSRATAKLKWIVTDIKSLEHLAGVEKS
ncbi:MAG: hypothetical protein M1831_005286 [Alyxoria varia]|nr:MAG: hypothetical protein M1831_005286 [Alyxoria varia]